MNKEQEKQQVINNLKAIQASVQNALDAFYADQLNHRHAEDSMNYIRLCTQKVQLHLKNCIETTCQEQPFMADFVHESLERIRRKFTESPELFDKHYRTQDN